jgi:hypothetical protein
VTEAEHRQALLDGLEFLLGLPGKATLPQVKPLVRAFMGLSGNEVGGALHPVLEDGNYADSDVAWCLGEAVRRGDHVGVLLAALLLRMSRTQRSKLAMQL